MRYSYQVPIIFPSSRKIIVFERCDNITDFLWQIFQMCNLIFVDVMDFCVIYTSSCIKPSLFIPRVLIIFYWIVKLKCLFGDENCVLYINTMWSEIVEYLKDPSLVAQFQTFFGVKTRYTKSSKDYSDKNSHSETRDIKSHKFKHNTNNCSVK